jgi:glutamyl-tRNA reductase
MHLLLAGLNHKTTPLEKRERLAFDAQGIERALPQLAAQAGLYEAVLLSTCNRTELYGTALSVHGHRRMTKALAELAGLAESELESFWYLCRDGEAVDHLYRVSAGLDSLVMGEPQILGQVRKAYELAHDSHTTGARLSRLFHGAVEVGKAVRSSTGLGATPVSIATIALQLARRLLGELFDRRVLVIGAGEMCETVAALASERHPGSLVVINRTLARAEALAQKVGGQALPWTDLESELCQADVVLTGTGAVVPVVTQEMLGRVAQARDGQRLVIIDMGMPRDVEAGVGCFADVFLYDIDDLRGIAQEHLRQREAEVPRAEGLVADAQQRYLAWLDGLAVVPTIVDLRSRLESIRETEVRQHLGKISGLDERGERRIEQLTQAIVNKILHDPLVRLKQRATDDTGGVLAESLRYLFALDDSKVSS